MEEQAAQIPQVNLTPQPTAPVANTLLPQEPPKESKGKTGLLAGVLIVLVILLGAGFIFLRQGGSDNSNSTPNNQSSQTTDELDAAAAKLDTDLSAIDSLNTDLNQINTSNDNEPAY